MNENSKGMLLILDGWGESDDTIHNAVALANTPNFDRLFTNELSTNIHASQSEVGLSKGTPGNSEVGHLTLGAGRVIDYESTRVANAIKDGTFYENSRLIDSLEEVTHSQGAVHLLGLLSDGNVHSHVEHFLPLIRSARQKGIKDVYLHLITDGRDCAHGHSLNLINMLEDSFTKEGIGQIASLVGREYAMERNGDWKKTQKVYELLTSTFEQKYSSATEALETYHENDIKDDLLPPTLIQSNFQGISNRDLLIAVNFRGDRMRQVLTPFVDSQFDGFFVENKVFPNVLSMCDYFMNPKVTALFPQETIKNGLADIFEKNKIKNLRVSETEKFPHVTFFINGREEKNLTYQSSIHVKSPNTDNYLYSPEMSSNAIAEEVIIELTKKEHDFLIVNLVAADILGHTGDLDAVIQAVEAVDKALGRIIDNANSNGYFSLICGDHGNAEEMWNTKTNVPHVGHTTNPVPLVLAGTNEKGLSDNGALSDIAPTILDLLEVEIPSEMNGKSLLVKEKVGV